MMGVRPQVAVIGAGVGGIACAYRLKRAGFQTTVFEKSNAVGGRTRTVWRNGFGFDTGAGALPSTSREVRSLLQSLNVEDEIEKRGATIGVYRHGSIERIRRRQPQSLLRFGALSTSSK
ncbi:MAG: FAD-dependent oxidoreductase, partial [Actinomycetota bacterium]|nr:FAD-dependent oxidoreductase [Actinomycetota bacterium]